MTRWLRASAPGRVCLFGEHLDYLGLPVIAAAVSLRIGVEGGRRGGRTARVSLPDIGEAVEIPLDATLAYEGPRDYLRSSVNVLRRAGCSWSDGIDARFRGDIPINAGTSSSSAMVVAWIAFLAAVSDQRLLLTPERTAHLAWEAEVDEFREPGGKMDHYSSAIGGVVHLAFAPQVRATTLPAELGTFVLGNSHEPKDTTRILATVKERVIAAAAKLRERVPGFNLADFPRAEMHSLQGHLDVRERALLDGTLRNRDLTKAARERLEHPNADSADVGDLMNEHQSVLRDVLGISTPKIDRMIEAVLGAGATGAKINGSGGGGCMFAHAPTEPERVAEAITKAGGTATIMRIGTGVTVEEVET